MSVYRTISIIKDLTYLVSNLSKSCIQNDMFDFNVLKFFYINTLSGQILSPLSVR